MFPSLRRARDLSVSFVGPIGSRKLHISTDFLLPLTRIIMSSSGEERTNGHYQHSRHMFVPDLLILLSDFMAKDVTLRYVRCMYVLYVGLSAS